MKKLTKEQTLQIAEIAGASSFILIAYDTKLPCEDTIAGRGCQGGHPMKMVVHHIDHQHTVNTLQFAADAVMNKGLPE